MKKITYILFLGFLFAQFGKNIVQYEEFDWKYIQTAHFDIYYYNNGYNHALFTAEESEIAYDHISSRLDWDLKNRVSIIIYNSHNDFQQTNVVQMFMPEGVGGVTELYKNRIVIPFDGSILEFKHVIHHELVHAFINDCVYRGSIQNMIANSVKVRIPNWMNEGLAEYLSTDWETNSDMWIRELSTDGKDLPNINQLTGYLAYRGGQSVWKFITSKWGEESIAQIIKQIKNKNNVNEGLNIALGIDFETLNKQWHEYLKSSYWPQISQFDKLDNISRQLTNHEKWGNSYNIAPSISPDGSKIALLSNKTGNMSIYLVSPEDGSIINKIIEGERSSEFEELHILKPGISWSPDSKFLAFSAKSGHSDALFILDINTNKKRKFRFGLEGIFRPSWSPNGKMIAFIGNNGESSDIYIFNVNSEQIENITSDCYSDDHVSWNLNSKQLYFISDRGENLSRCDNENYYHSGYNDQMDIYSISILDKKIERITATPYNESYPIFSDEQSLFYISDISGINNIYVKNEKDDGIPITNISTGITQLSWNGDKTQLIFTGFINRGYDIFTLSNPYSLINNVNVIDAAWKSDLIDTTIKQNPKEKVDSIRLTEKYANYNFIEDQSLHDIVLDNSEVKNSKGEYNVIDYKTRYTLDYGQAYLAYDARFGNQGMAQFLFSDILGNHRFYIASEMEITLKGSDYLISYENLEGIVDWKYLIFHNSYQYLSSANYSTSTIAYIRNRILGFLISAQKPVSRFARFETSLSTNYIENARVEEYRDIFGFTEENEIIDYSAVNMVPGVRYIWDNTIWEYIYPVRGSRTNIKYEISPKINSESIQFQKIEFDSRIYKRLASGISIGARFSGGSVWGPNSNNIRFRLGQPAIASKDGYQTDQQSTSDEIFYASYLYPLRGVGLFDRFGKNALLFNLEFRMPFLLYYFPAIRYIGQINGAIFADLGVAWNSKFPRFLDEQYWHNPNIENSYEQSVGWTMSYGFGPRFIFLGYPWRLDYAWEYNPHLGIISDRKWYLTIGLDF